MRKILFPVIASLLLSLTTACSPPVVTQRFFWPPPPLEPKVEYIRIYASSRDMISGQFSLMMHEFTGGKDLYLRQPIGVTGDHQGKVYVSDGVLDEIFIFDFVNNTLSAFNVSQKLKQPFGLDTDSKGNLYVVERKGKQVQVFNPEQKSILIFGQEDLGDPLRIAVDEARNRVYVSDIKDQQVKVFNLEGKFIQAIGGEKGFRSEFDGEFNRPNGVTVDKAGNLYVCDQLNARIQVFDPTGRFLRKFGIRGDQIDNFEAPTEIAFDPFGNLWIVDIRKGALLTYTATEEPRFLFATYGANKEEAGYFNFKTPTGIFINKEGRIYVPDAMLRRMSTLQYLSKDYLTQHPLPADWMQRTDILDIWYLDSGMTPPKKQEGK